MAGNRIKGITIEIGGDTTKSQNHGSFDTAFYRKSRKYHILRDSGSRKNKSCSINRDRSCKTQILRIFYNISGFNITAKKAASENRLETRIKWFCRYKLLIIDELGYQKMDVDSANLFFNLIAKRYEKLSTIITTNSPFSKWSDIFQAPVLTNALLDKLLHHCSVININGPSYRLKNQMQYMIEEN